MTSNLIGAGQLYSRPLVSEQGQELGHSVVLVHLEKSKEAERTIETKSERQLGRFRRWCQEPPLPAATSRWARGVSWFRSTLASLWAAARCWPALYLWSSPGATEETKEGWFQGRVESGGRKSAFHHIYPRVLKHLCLQRIEDYWIPVFADVRLCVCVNTSKASTSCSPVEMLGMWMVVLKASNISISCSTSFLLVVPMMSSFRPWRRKKTLLLDPTFLYIYIL